MSEAPVSQPDLPAVDSLSYEQARDELVRIVARIESGDAPLEEAMALWERGEALAAHCQAKLDQAQARLDQSEGTARGSDQPDRPAEVGSEQGEGSAADEG